MLEKLEEMGRQARSKLAEVSDGETLQSWYSQYLGKKGEMTGMLRRVGELSREERPAFGKRSNQL